MSAVAHPLTVRPHPPGQRETGREAHGLRSDIDNYTGGNEEGCGARGGPG